MRQDKNVNKKSKNIIFKILKWGFACLSAIFFIGCVLFFVWVSHYSRADKVYYQKALKNEGIIISTQGDFITISPSKGNSTTALLFYPGAKVESEAYVAKLSKLAEKTNMHIVIGRPPFKLAFFSINQADKMQTELPDIDNLYVGGHSLGGSMACIYAANHADHLKGVILFGTYCGNDLSATKLHVLSINGDTDGIFPPVIIDQKRSNLPADATMVQIKGMNHAQFGNYGDQKGDNKAKISDDFALESVMIAVENFLK